MNEYSQITFDFFTPPSATVKKPGNEDKPEHFEQLKSAEPEQTDTALTEEVVDIVFREQLAPANTLEEAESGIIEAAEPAPTSAVAAVVTKSTRGRKSLKSLAAGIDLLNIPEDDVLFQKQYYSIGEVGEMFQVNASLLRFWESEFDIIQPRKNRKGDRHFRPVDIKNLQLIYDLLRRRKLTIEGAKDFIKKNSKAKERFEAIQNLRKIRSFLAELKGSL
ncbi:MAG TPA: MerR family transcriptional regulator [Flavitalea sp.]|nr:MerR family transcriptional regulator [Flavitalea sp.]